MANLIIPNPQQHKYVVGIDFGHGETSAAICEIDWEKHAGLSDTSVSDVRINPANTGNEKVLVSAISQISGQKPQIGENAFGAEQLQDNASIRVCFKEPPHSIDGEAETLMTTFMKAVYENIRSISPKLTDGNHIVYIARPSGWQDEKTKELYMQMALRAGLPLGGLTSESRAAIFYALNDPKIAFQNEIAEGAIVFDLGSSTLDFTYIASDQKPIDYGYPHGASLIDEVIFEDKMATCEGVKRLLANHSQYKPALLFQARKLKEDFYKKTLKTAAIDIAVPLRNIISGDCTDYNNLKNELVIVEYENLDAFNETLETQIGYKTKIRTDLADFKNNYIGGKTIKGVFLTGGASRMSFIADIIREEYNLSEDAVKVDPDNPSLTISRGIAMLGRADAFSGVLQKKLIAKAKSADSTPFVEAFKIEFTNELTNWYWKKLEDTVFDYAKAKADLTLKDLFNLFNATIKDVSNINSIQKKVLQKCAKNNINSIQKELNDIISLYQPGYEIQESTIDGICVNLDTINKALAVAMNSVVDQVKNVISTTVITTIFGWVFIIMFGPIVGGILAALIEALLGSSNTNDEKLTRPRDKKYRANLFEKIRSNKEEICKKISEPILKTMNADTMIVKALDDAFKSHLNEVVMINIDNVKIDIE